MTVEDHDALKAFQKLSVLEGIIPAFESAHAISWLDRLARGDERMRAEFKTVVLCLSGRGDKDVHQAEGFLSEMLDDEEVR